MGIMHDIFIQENEAPIQKKIKKDFSKKFCYTLLPKPKTKIQVFFGGGGGVPQNLWEVFWGGIELNTPSD